MVTVGIERWLEQNAVACNATPAAVTAFLTVEHAIVGARSARSSAGAAMTAPRRNVINKARIFW